MHRSQHSKGTKRRLSLAQRKEKSLRISNSKVSKSILRRYLFESLSTMDILFEALDQMFLNFMDQRSPIRLVQRVVNPGLIQPQAAAKVPKSGDLLLILGCHREMSKSWFLYLYIWGFHWSKFQTNEMLSLKRINKRFPLSRQ